MQKVDDIPETAEESLELALTTLLDIAQTAKSRYCKLELDGTDYSGDYLLLEIMNGHSIGPNLKPGATGRSWRWPFRCCLDP